MKKLVLLTMILLILFNAGCSKKEKTSDFINRMGDTIHISTLLEIKWGRKIDETIPIVSYYTSMWKRHYALKNCPLEKRGNIIKSQINDFKVLHSEWKNTLNSLVDTIDKVTIKEIQRARPVEGWGWVGTDTVIYFNYVRQSAIKVAESKIKKLRIIENVISFLFEKLDKEVDSYVFEMDSIGKVFRYPGDMIVFDDHFLQLVEKSRSKSE